MQALVSCPDCSGPAEITERFRPAVVGLGEGGGAGGVGAENLIHVTRPGVIR
jgi:hypothetical protein